MQNNKRAKRPILRILFCIFCFMLLAFLLYATQFTVSCYTHYINAMTELEQVRDSLSSQSRHDDYLQRMEERYRQNIQIAALLLSDEEFTSEKLAAVIESQELTSGIIIFQEDGTPICSYGEVSKNPAFLNRLHQTGNEKDENGFSYRSIPFQNDLDLAISFASDLTEEDYRTIQFDASRLEDLESGMTGDLIIINLKDNGLLYGPESLTGKTPNDFMLTTSEDDPIMHIIAVDGIPVLTPYLAYEDYLLLTTLDTFVFFQNLHGTTMPALLGFGFLIFLLLTYTEFIRIDMSVGRLGKIHYVQFGKKRYLNTVLLRKLSGFALIGITCIICATYCLQLLIRSDEQRQNAESRLEIAARILEENQTNLAEIEKQDMAHLVDMTRTITSLLSANPELQSEDGLNSISRLYGINDIYMLNDVGKPVVSSTNLQSFMLSSNAADDTYVFWDVINGFVESHVQIVRNDPYNQDMDMVYVGLATSDNHGMIMITLSYDAFKAYEKDYDTETVLKTIGLDSQSTLLAIQADSTTCVYDSSNQYTGLSLDTYGIDSAFLRNGYTGTHQFDGRDCLINTRLVLDWYLLYITPTTWISVSSWIFTVLVICTGLLVVIIAVLPWLLVHTPGEDLRKRESKDPSVSHRSHIDAIVTRDGEVELVKHQVEQNSLKKRWRRMNANEKLSHLIRLILLPVSCSLLLFLLFGLHIGDHPLADRILDRNWDKSLNVYAFSYVVIVLAGIWFVAKLLQAITLFVTGTFSRRWKTLGILISNVIRYSALIVSIFFTLQNFGVETSALITSASVLTLIFGLGCQSFVADMVAGVFLIFEGTFRVGDIVTVDNWRGEVVEIGLRSTNVKNELGNIKVFQNSRISGAINMTRDLTCAVCDIILPPGEPLEAFEQKLTSDFFPIARESISSIRMPLIYEGVVAINGDSATLRISVKCLESEREQLKRDLYRALKLWRENNR